MEIRTATPDDAKFILGIYAPFIKNTAVTFEEEVPDIITFQKRMEVTLQQFPWLVSIENNMVTGYAYAATIYKLWCTTVMESSGLLLLPR